MSTSHQRAHRRPPQHPWRKRAVTALALLATVAWSPAQAAPPGPSLSVADAQVVEGDSGYVDLVFTVTLSNPTGRTITVDYSTSDATATAPGDYQPRSGQLVFNKKETVKQIKVPVYGDTVYEGDETFALMLSNAGSAVIGDGSAVGTIVENDPATYPLTVTRTGSGAVTSTPAGISCGSDCSEDLPSGSSVTLAAAPAPGWEFAGWSGACTGATGCTVAMSQARAVTATFTEIPSYVLTVSTDGAGSGTVTSSPAGITCGADCTESYPRDTDVALTATPAAGSTFAGWSGACTGSGACTVAMTQARALNATFTLAPPTTQTLTVAVTGERRSAGMGIEDATGTVTSSPAGIECGTQPPGAQYGDCSEAYDTTTVVTLTATSGPVYGNGIAGPRTSVFTGWSGACSGTAACVVTMDQAHTVTASFGFPSGGSIRVFVGGDDRDSPGSGSFVQEYASGEISSSPAGIECAYTADPAWDGGHPMALSGDCAEEFTEDTEVTLTATPGAVIQSIGTGPSPSTEQSVFLGWSGACSGTGTCVVTVSQTREVMAAFGFAPLVDLSVQTSGSTRAAGTSVATGEVTSSPSGIDCDWTVQQGHNAPSQTGSCASSYVADKVVTLTASPGPVYGPDLAFGLEPTSEQSTFTGWGGACSGTGSCVVTMSEARNVTARFGFSYQLDVGVAGDRRTGSSGLDDYATGAVTSSPAGIDCQLVVNPTFGGPMETGECARTYAEGALVTLTPEPGPVYVVSIGGYGPANESSRFAGWSGACSGTGACVVTMDQARNVTATFGFGPPKVLSVSVSGASRTDLLTTSKATGKVTGTGIDCQWNVATNGSASQQGTCSASQPYGAQVTLTATPGKVFASGLFSYAPTSQDSTFTGWAGGGCSGTAPTCTVPMDQARNVTAGFGLP